MCSTALRYLILRQRAGAEAHLHFYNSLHLTMHHEGRHAPRNQCIELGGCDVSFRLGGATWKTRSHVASYELWVGSSSL